MSKAWKNLAEVLEDGTFTNEFDFAGTYNNVSYTIFSTDFFIDFLCRLHRNRNILLDSDNPETDLIALFNRWESNRAETYARRAYALSIDYNPLENYDSTEERSGSGTFTHGQQISTNASTTYGHEINKTGTENKTTTYDEATTDNASTTGAKTVEEATTDTLTLNKANSETRSVYGFNSSSASPSEATSGTDTGTESRVIEHDISESTTGTDTTSGTHTGTVGDAITTGEGEEHSGTDTSTGTEAHTGTDSTTDSYTLTRHGNIGVTTSQQMLVSDLDLLNRDLAITCIFEFLDSYTYAYADIDL